jgi:hypothetical protein
VAAGERASPTGAGVRGGMAGPRSEFRALALGITPAGRRPESPAILAGRLRKSYGRCQLLAAWRSISRLISPSDIGLRRAANQVSPSQSAHAIAWYTIQFHSAPGAVKRAWKGAAVGSARVFAGAPQSWCGTLSDATAAKRHLEPVRASESQGDFRLPPGDLCPRGGRRRHRHRVPPG